MSHPTNPYVLPADLPVPVDDGAADHLPGARVPDIALPSTGGGLVRLDRQPTHWVVVYCYPLTGRPDEEVPGGTAAWNAIPGARGCTPQSCGGRALRLSGISTRRGRGPGARVAAGGGGRCVTERSSTWATAGMD